MGFLIIPTMSNIGATRRHGMSPHRRMDLDLLRAPTLSSHGPRETKDGIVSGWKMREEKSVSCFACLCQRNPYSRNLWKPDFAPRGSTIQSSRVCSLSDFSSNNLAKPDRQKMVRINGVTS